MSYNMIIADDEEFSRDGVRRLVELTYPQINIAAVFQDGTELIDYLSKNTVDIVITDINMPHVSGLDVAEYIKNHNLHTCIIIMTGYSLFEYAKKAIDFKVDCFLTKPFLSEELIAAINAIIEKIQIRTSLSIEMANEQLQSHVYKRNFLAQIYSGRPSDKLNGLTTQNFFANRRLSEVQLTEVTFRSDGKEIRNLQNEAIDIGEYFSSDYASYLIAVNDTEFVFLILQANFNDNDHSEHFASEFIHSFKLFHSAAFSYTVRKFENDEDWFLHCRFINICRAYLGKMMTEHFSLANDILMHDLNNMAQSELLMFYQTFLDTINNTFAMTLQNNMTHNHSIKQIRSDLAFVHQEIIQRSSNAGDIISRIKACIDTNYGDYDFSLINLAKQFHMSETYLSKLFKDKTNVRFVDYLVQVRIENAKKMLKTGKYKIYEVSQAVGYSQAKYFRLVFKKHTGITASEYSKISAIGGDKP